MHKALFTLIILVATFVTHSASAQRTYVYLGGARSALHCSRVASAAGYKYYAFGGYVNGIYIANACLGSNEDEGTFGENTVWEVLAYEDAKSCKEDIEFRVEKVTCRVQSERELECKSKRQDSAKTEKEIYGVKCVKKVKRS